MKVDVLSFSLLLVYVLFCGLPVTSSLIKRQGDFTIASLLPVHHSSESSPGTCSDKLDFKRVVETEAIVFAVSKVNSDPGVLPGNSLGYDVEDTCGDDAKRVLDKVTTLLKRHQKVKQPLVAFILDLPQILGQLVAMYKLEDIPVFSLGGPPGLNAGGNVFYLSPGQPRLSNALLSLIQKLKWTVVDVLVENEKNYQIFVDAVKDANICVGNVFRAKQNTTQVRDGRQSKAPLLVFSDTVGIFSELPARFFRGREIAIASDLFLESAKNLDNIDYLPSAIAVQRRPAELKDFRDQLWKSARNNESWLGEILGREPGFRSCGGHGNDTCMSGVLDRLSTELRHAGKVIDAIYSVAHALNITSSRPLTNKGLLRMPEMTSLTGNRIRFTENKVLYRVDYEVCNLVRKSAILVGKVTTFPETSDTVVDVDVDKIEWATKMRTDNSSCTASCPEGVTVVPMTGPLARCCVTCRNDTETAPDWMTKANSSGCGEGRRLNKEGTKCVVVTLDYLRWRHPVSLIVMVLVVFLFCTLVYLVNLYVRKQHMPTIAASPLATVPLLLSLFVTLILPLLPILKPTTTACNAYTFGFIQGLGIPLCILISRSKSVHARFRTDDGTLKKKVCRGDPQNIIAIILILVQLALSIVLLAMLPAHVVHFATDDPSVDYIECSTFSGEGFLFPFFLTIILTIIFTVKNFGAVTREEDIYESHFVALSIFGYYFLSFIMLVSIYGVVGKIKIILVCVVSLLYVLNYLLFIFFPKIYVVVYKRDPSSFSPFPLMVLNELYVVSEEPIKDDEPSF